MTHCKGWGGEDDDLLSRTTLAFGDFLRQNASIAKYVVNGHPDAARNPDRFKIIDQSLRIMNESGFVEGITTLKYRLLRAQRTQLYTKFYVNYDHSIAGMKFFVLLYLFLVSALLMKFFYQLFDKDLRNQLRSIFFVEKLSILLLFVQPIILIVFFYYEEIKNSN